MKTEKVTLIDTEFQLGEFYLLEAELKGKTEVNPEGFLAQDLGLRTKYDFTKLAEGISAEVKSLNDFKNELITKLGVVSEDGSAMIPEFVDLNEVKTVKKGGPKVKATVVAETEDTVGPKVEKLMGPNPKFKQFHTEFGEFMTTKKSIQHKPFDIEILDGLKTKENFPTLFKLFSEGE